MKINYAGCLLIMSLVSMVAQGQTFSSGSTGSDGALNYPTPGTYVFNPASFTPAARSVREWNLQLHHEYDCRRSHAEGDRFRIQRPGRLPGSGSGSD